MRDVFAQGRPALEWVLRWSAGGREPFAAAWAASESPHWMLQAMLFAWPPERPEALRALRAATDASTRGLFADRLPDFVVTATSAQFGYHRLPPAVGSSIADYAKGRPERLREICDAIRAATSTPPALAEVIAAMAR